MLNLRKPAFVGFSQCHQIISSCHAQQNTNRRGYTRFSQKYNSTQHPLGLSLRCYSSGTPPQFSSSDYYIVLGIKQSATHAQVKKAYIELCKIYHPDVNPDKSAKATFANISQAYDVLGNHKKRHMYDRGALKVGASANTEAAASEDFKREEATRRASQQFKEQGGGKERGPIPTGRSRIYNFDEFYKQHYGSLLRKKQNFIKSEKLDSGADKLDEDGYVGNRREKIGGIATVLALVSLLIGLTARAKLVSRKPPF